MYIYNVICTAIKKTDLCAANGCRGIQGILCHVAPHPYLLP